MRSLKWLLAGLLLLPLGALAQTANCVPKYTSISPQNVLGCSSATDNGTTFAIGEALTATSLNGLTTPTVAGQAKLPELINNGTLALSSGSAITTGNCATVTVASASVLTTDKLTINFIGDITGTTGYIPGAMLSVVPWLSAGNVNIKTCNNTASTITPSALSVLWWVERY